MDYEEIAFQIVIRTHKSVTAMTLTTNYPPSSVKLAAVNLYFSISINTTIFQVRSVIVQDHVIVALRIDPDRYSFAVKFWKLIVHDDFHCFPERVSFVFH